MKTFEVRILLCLIILIVTGYALLYEKPDISPSAYEYKFIEATDFEPENWVLFGSSVSYVDGHLSNSVEIALNNVKPIESFQVFLDNKAIKIVYKEAVLGEKKDRLFYSHLVNDLDLYLDNIKVYNNNMRVYFVKSEWAVE